MVTVTVITVTFLSLLSLFNDSDSLYSDVTSLMRLMAVNTTIFISSYSDKIYSDFFIRDSEQNNLLH